MFDKGKKGGDGTQEETSREAGRPAVAAAPAKPQTSGTSHREAAMIGPSIHIDGDLRGEEDLLIDGEVNGTVNLKSHSLTIGAHGKVRADVYAHSIYVEGLMEGDLFGSERVAIRKTAELRGNITSPRVSLEEGARFKGSIEMDVEAVKAALGSQHSPGASVSSAAASGSVQSGPPKGGSESGFGKSGTSSVGTAAKSGAAG